MMSKQFLMHERNMKKTQFCLALYSKLLCYEGKAPHSLVYDLVQPFPSKERANGNDTHETVWGRIKARPL